MQLQRLRGVGKPVLTELAARHREARGIKGGTGMRGVIGAPRCVMIVSVALSCLIRPRARGTGGLCRGYVVGVSEGLLSVGN
jgi:hypothetical protein